MFGYPLGLTRSLQGHGNGIAYGRSRRIAEVQTGEISGGS